MQLMPDTAAQMARKMNIAKFKTARLTADPKFNVTLGRGYLDNLVDRFDGSYLLATAAYNAGPGRVRQWMDQYGDPGRPIPSGRLDREHPFDETRNYVPAGDGEPAGLSQRLTKGASKIALETTCVGRRVN